MKSISLLIGSYFASCALAGSEGDESGGCGESSPSGETTKPKEPTCTGAACPGNQGGKTNNYGGDQFHEDVIKAIDVRNAKELLDKLGCLNEREDILNYEKSLAGYNSFEHPTGTWKPETWRLYALYQTFLEKLGSGYPTKTQPSDKDDEQWAATVTANQKTYDDLKNAVDDAYDLFSKHESGLTRRGKPAVETSATRDAHLNLKLQEFFADVWKLMDNDQKAAGTGEDAHAKFYFLHADVKGSKKTSGAKGFNAAMLANLRKGKGTDGAGKAKSCSEIDHAVVSQDDNVVARANQETDYYISICEKMDEVDKELFDTEFGVYQARVNGAFRLFARTSFVTPTSCPANECRDDFLPNLYRGLQNIRAYGLPNNKHEADGNNYKDDTSYYGFNSFFCQAEDENELMISFQKRAISFLAPYTPSNN